jgi:hypothetical protein
MGKAGKTLKKMSGSKLRQAAFSPKAPRRQTAKSHVVGSGNATITKRGKY